MKKIFLLAASSLLAGLLGSANQTSPEANTNPAPKTIDVACNEASQPKQVQTRGIGQVFTAPELVGYSSVNFKDKSGPRRVKYGKHRWVLLT